MNGEFDTFTLPPFGNSDQWLTFPSAVELNLLKTHSVRISGIAEREQFQLEIKAIMQGGGSVLLNRLRALGFAASFVEESCPKRLLLYFDVKIDSLLKGSNGCKPFVPEPEGGCLKKE